LRRSLCAAWLFAASALPASAQTVQVWPEVDVFVRLNDKARLLLVATTVNEDDQVTDGEFGVSFDVHRKPIRRPPKLLFQLDESKNQVLTIRSSYRYMPSYSSGSTENRGSLEATVRYPLTRRFGHVLISARNRIDFRVIDGEYSWRYRNRLSTERELSVGPVRVNPYSRFEVFYDSRFSAFSKTELMVGASFPLAKYCELEGYFDHQLDTGRSPNRTIQAVGAVATFYF
jgi:hypothetical protein